MATADRLAAPRTAIVLACGPKISLHTAESLRDRPVQDFTVLQEDHDTVIIDTAVATRGRFARLVARWVGSAWVVAFLALRAAGRHRVLICLSDDIGVPVSALKHVIGHRVPVLFVCQHMRSKKALLLLGKLGTHRNVQLFFASSKAQQAMMVTELGIPEAKIELGYDYTDPDFFQPFGRDRERRQIASAGSAERDYATLMRATKDLDVDVKIDANSAWYSEPSNHAAADLHDRVELCTGGTTKDLREIYADSQIIVVPLRENDHPAGYNVILEGMAMAKPVIASNIKYIGDFIDDGRTGFLVPPHDDDALRSQIEKLLDDEELRHRVGEAARIEVLDRFTTTHFRRRIAEAVERFGVR